MNDIEADLLITNAKIKQLEKELEESHCEICKACRERRSRNEH